MDEFDSLIDNNRNNEDDLPIVKFEAVYQILDDDLRLGMDTIVTMGRKVPFNTMLSVFVKRFEGAKDMKHLREMLIYTLIATNGIIDDMPGNTMKFD